MNFWQLPRVPEPEEMDEVAEVASYSSAAAEHHLDAIDNTFVEHFLRLLPAVATRSVSPLRALDVGTGPAQIPIKILGRVPSLKIVGVDRSANMLACARNGAQQAGVSDRLVLLRADGHALPFRNGSFAAVLCNSMLHHVRDPLLLMREIFRVATRDAAVLLRDLRRPARPLLPWHLWRHGRHYRGEMRRLFNASVQAAYTVEELDNFLRQAGTHGATVFRHGGAHLGIERPAADD